MKFTVNVYVQILNAIISQYNSFQKYVDDFGSSFDFLLKEITLVLLRLGARDSVVG
jgi:hypothetical protein